ncbi:GNAT family N-acetyltransferase [Botrimarina mediterranea]|uniref:Acetyltransferase (GNAT) family protein n=1 Tax=Botrimarina mediterranea TaxID=2528022 RepID=A0A518KDW2_9BACT|nr:GNAT family N-acetyltransferase [Botrimarina mediterranea]QDV75949.1 Acetyltransferase (GNAT) family protein [Botrimarina mediterranea]QDV80544.1 Acetyltransferase (GNAT) family protein [Planctomycetes bacterium K2D]
MHVRPIQFGSLEYAAYCDLRHRFLREPLGLRLTPHDVEGEETQHLYGLFTEEPGNVTHLIGGLIGKADDDATPRADTVRLRQVVVSPDWRSQGAGRQLLLQSEQLLVKEGFRRFALYAREDAVGFYLRNGYQPTGKRAELIGLEHELLEKYAEG